MKKAEEIYEMYCDNFGEDVVVRSDAIHRILKREGCDQRKVYADFCDLLESKGMVVDEE